MCNCNRRTTLLMLTVLPITLAACRKQTDGPEEVRYGREACTMCGMIISDPHFAAEVRGGPDNNLVKFDDIGDAVNWLKMQDWRDTQLSEFWVMDFDTGTKWLDARKAYYTRGVVSPMDYGYGASEAPLDGSVDFAAMSNVVIEKGLSSNCLPTAAASHKS